MCKPPLYLMYKFFPYFFLCIPTTLSLLIFKTPLNFLGSLYSFSLVPYEWNYFPSCTALTTFLSVLIKNRSISFQTCFFSLFLFIVLQQRDIFSSVLPWHLNFCSLFLLPLTLQHGHVEKKLSIVFVILVHYGIMLFSIFSSSLQCTQASIHSFPVFYLCNGPVRWVRLSKSD